jgi:cobalt/nickel transport system permease protein
MKRGFIERTLDGLASVSDFASSAERIATSRGVLQAIDPRIKVAATLALIVTAALSRRFDVIAAILAIPLALAIASRVPIVKLAKWVWIPVVAFSGVIALPAFFLVSQRSAEMLLARAATSATLGAVLALTTPWPSILKSLRWFRVPAVLVAILAMTYRYIFVILETARDTFIARKSRTVGVLPPRESRRIATGAAGALMSRSIHLADQVHLAMQSRGFRGEIMLIDDPAERS